jgi:hypothetical protein
MLAYFAPPLAEPDEQLLARGGDRDGVGDDRALVLPEGYARMRLALFISKRHRRSRAFG